MSHSAGHARGTLETPEPASTAPYRRAGAPLRVLLADDDETVRQALAELLDAEDSLELVGVAEDAAEAVDLAARLQPDVALLDVRMPAGGGRRAAREIRERSPGTRLVALSAYADRGAVVDMVGAGVVGYIVKGARGDEIVRAVHHAVQGRTSLSDDVTGEVLGELSAQLQRREAGLRDREQKVERIEQVLDSRALEVVYQPVVSLEDGSVAGAEALSRFPGEPYRPPNVWFAEAAEVGLGIELELLAMETVVAHLDAIPGFLCLNASPETLVSPAFRSLCASVPVERLVVEITEHATVADYDVLAAALENARTGGLRVAVDDAGAGYASLRHILRLAPDVIKLDSSLTRDVDADPHKRALAAALVPFAAETGAVLIAEGIETADELATMRRLGARYAQGYHLGRPQPLPLPVKVPHAAPDRAESRPLPHGGDRT
jgi:EAL domain-containing protein (putative c-di-GMP-specific phosphodiesterase class I)/CheY-like chemotaxis protein